MTDNNHIWTKLGTDIAIRWKMNGWVPPSELREYRDKWKYYQELPLRSLDDSAKEQYEIILKRAKVARIK